VSGKTVLTLRSFLLARFGDSFPGYLVLWCKATKLTACFAAGEVDALLKVVEAGPEQDWYVALGTQTERLLPQKRGSVGSVKHVPGFFADIDFREAEDRADYPVDEEEALRVLATFSIQPSAIVRSGGGLHVHWFLDKGFEIGRPKDLKLARDISDGFQHALVSHFQLNGRKIDSVGDLARLFRLPGTLNHKTVPPREVSVLRCDDGHRVSLMEVERLLRSLGVALRVNDPPKGKTKRKETFDASHETIAEACAWYGLVTGSGAPACDEPNWFAAASITARCTDGEAVFHQYSAKHPNYEQGEAGKKLERGRTGGGPRTCASIADLGHGQLCAVCPHKGKITSPIELGRPGKKWSGAYDPGTVGPMPLGYAGGELLFRHQQTHQVVRYSPMQLAPKAMLFGMAPKSFWELQFPKITEGGAISIDVDEVVNALIQACRAKGVIPISNIRGAGLWRDGDHFVANFTSDVIEGGKFLYVPPRQDFKLERKTVDVAPIREFFGFGNWSVPHAGDVLLGMCMIAPLAGALEWRPHLAITGAAQSGKSTIIKGVGNLLSPLALLIEGNSTEAGIRQTIGPDARPVVIDEFETESSQDAARVGRIIRLMRSASSATGETARGTPDGKPLHFNLRATFIVGAINLYRVSAADTSRIIRLELKAHTSEKAARRRLLELQDHMAQCGPAFCQFAIDQAENTLASITIIHRHMEVIQSRQADNMAAVLGGLWSAFHERQIKEEEAPEFIRAYETLIQDHGEATHADDAFECLEAFLTHGVGVGNGETRTLGSLLSEDALGVASSGTNRPAHFELLSVYGIKLHDGGFVVANSHSGLTKIFQSTRWAGGQWSQALVRLPGASKSDLKRFSGQRSRGVWIPSELVEEGGVRKSPEVRSG
jgi:hypothetical protein